MPGQVAAPPLSPDERLVVKVLAAVMLPLFYKLRDEDGRRALLEDWGLPPRYVDPILRTVEAWLAHKADAWPETQRLP